MTDLKKKRLESGLTLREHCRQNGLDPVVYSKLERGVTGPLTDDELMTKLPLFINPKLDDKKLDELVELIRNS